ncbi:MAG: serine/threonine protein kinase [Deltaproteobacteria bacterium]|nr:MAG: serine/threonine protein kinase [Deltaproteobacteria bacterium]
MNENQRQALLRRAHALAESGETAAAVAAYRQASEPKYAARVLLAAERPLDAAGELLRACGVSPGTRVFQPRWIQTRSANERELLKMASICFRRAGDLDTYVALTVGLGERERAVQALMAAGKTVEAARLQASGESSAQLMAEERLALAKRLEAEGKAESAFAMYVEAGAPMDAARVALSLERFAEAGRLFTEAREDLRAANAWERAGDHVQALASYIDVPRDTPGIEAIDQRIADLACRTNTLDARVDARIQEIFLRLPSGPEEAERNVRLSRLYAAHGHHDIALEFIDGVLVRIPAHPEALELQKKFEAARGSEKDRLKSILEEEERFRAASSRTGLPDLPEHDALPDLPDGFTSFAQTAMARAKRRIAGQESFADPSPPPGSPTNSTGQVAASPTTADLASESSEASGPLQLEIGKEIAGRYRLEKELGVGGMAVVYRAYDTDLEEHVALKIFTQTVDDEVMLKRFKQELLLSRRLNHPNILRLYDIGTVQGRRFISMELLKGRDMADYLGKPVQFRLGINWMMQACDGLQAAHDAGVVHRDMKPHNLFVCEDGSVKVMDFGIAKNPSTNLTTDKMIAGTPDYMSPEQINGFSSVGPSTDIYALGITAFEIFCGRLPFVHDETVPLLLMHVGEPPPDPRSINPRIPDPLAELILRMLAKDPSHRPKSCADLRREFETVQQEIA